MTIVSKLIIAGIILAVLILIAIVMSKQYRKVGPNEVLIVSGGRKRTVVGPDGARRKVGYRYRLGGGTFVWPFFETVHILPMEVIPISVKTPDVLTHGGVPVMAEGVAQIKVDSSDQAVRLAAEQFLGLGKDGIRHVSLSILEGKMREVIGTMTVEDIYRGRQEFSNRVSQAALHDLSRMGLTLISFSLMGISDTQGYIDSLARPLISAAKRDAAVAEAETERDAIIRSSQARKEAEVARLQSEALIANAQWENEAKKAESQAAVNQKKAHADFSYEIERHRINQEIKKEEAKVRIIEKEHAIQIESLEITRREKELESGVIRTADARKYQVRAEAESEEFRIQAEARGKAEALRLEAGIEADKIRQKGLAEAETMVHKAKAWEKYNEAALLEMYLQVLPQLAKSIAEPLSKVDKIVIIGSDKELGTTKLTAQVGEILAQIPEVVKTLTGIDFQKFLKDKLTPAAKKDEKAG
ncbi:MAG: SPFH domain-containing protein [Candidatus Aminicenantes bacterium]|nr:SPFH domain-containing protein [Candidatus Aminicenantes bacterium]